MLFHSSPTTNMNAARLLSILGAVAAAALTEDGHANEIYEVTGPRMLTFAQAIREIAEAVRHLEPVTSFRSAY